MFLLWTSVNRLTRANIVLGAAERVTPYQGLLALTADAAYEYFEEHEKGTLEAGKLADLVILSANPLKVSANKIKEIRIVETIKAGETVYRR
jgi:predicted amidohydrolase YtcJ